jgi:MoCo/4Fe-4S cofactor protein with predicted Tat translocation signal
MTGEPRRDSGFGPGDLPHRADSGENYAPQSPIPHPQTPVLNPQSLDRSGFWRTLDERADDPAFRERLCNEFPSEVEAISDPVERRTFLKLMGASLALAGMTACTRQPAEK